MKRVFADSESKRFWQRAPWSYLVAALAVAFMTGFISVTHADANTANVPMMYLLVVMATALFLGRTAAVLASIASFLCFDFFFIDPKYQFTVQEPQEWMALFVFMLTATVTGQLTALLRARAEEAQRRKLETAALAEASWAVASELDRDRALSKVLFELSELVDPAEAALIAPSDQSSYEVLAYYNSAGSGAPDKGGIAGDAVQFVLAGGPAISSDSSKHWRKALHSSDQSEAYLPVLVENQVLGVLYMKLKARRTISPTETQLVESLRNHAAVVLLRDKLLKADARAQALAEADLLKTALLSMVSHDFRSPLTSIKASVSSLLEDGTPVEPDDQRALLQGVVHETDRLNRMVGNILDLSRLEAGAWRPRCEPTLIAELVSAALDNFSKDDNKRIQVALDKAVTEVNIDSVQMVQVLKNLLENAIKYSPAESPIELRTFCEEGSFLIEVLDRGPGLPKGEEQRIFEMFYRAPDLKETSVPGVGIGLTLCRGLVEANGGKLSALNRPEGGAAFRVTLPFIATA